MSTSLRTPKRKRNDTSDTLDSTDSMSSSSSSVTVLDTPERSSEGMRTPPTLLLTPGGLNIAPGQETVMRKQREYSEMIDRKQKYSLKVFNELLFDQYGNIEYDIRNAEKKLFYLVPATEEEIKQANNRQLMLYNKDGEPLQSNDLFNDMSIENSITSGFTSGDAASFGSMTKNGGKKRKSRKRTLHKKTNKKKTNRKKHTKKGKKKSKKHTRKKGGVRPPTPDPLATPVMNDVMDNLQRYWINPGLYPRYINEAFLVIGNINTIEALYREGELEYFFNSLIIDRFRTAIEHDRSNWDLIMNNIRSVGTGRIVGELRERNIMASNVYQENIIRIMRLNPDNTSVRI